MSSLLSLRTISCSAGVSLIFFILLPAIADERPAEQGGTADSEELLFIENSHVKVGIKKSSGGAIAWISKAASDRNLIDHFDRGRLVQQSYYGAEDGSRWNNQPWRWNPVQGGDWRGRSAAILELRQSSSELFVVTRPVHWATGEDVQDSRMEQTITLRDDSIHLRYRFEYRGELHHPVQDQELPAVFVIPELKHLVLYNGQKPWTDDELTRTVPSWPNQYSSLPEHWAAYVDDNGEGIGCYVPSADRITYYRFGDGDRSKGACSYLAPLTRFAITKDFTWDYEATFVLGTIDQIRTRFAHMHKSR